LRFGDAEFSGFVVEESIGGMKVSGLDLLCLPENQPVTIEYNDSVEHGVCRNLTRAEDGKMELGVMLRSAPVIAEPNGLLLSCFFSVQNEWVFCRPVRVDDKQKLTICLFDGKEFNVNRSDVTPLTCKEREASLQGSLERVQFLSNLYGMNSNPLSESIREILDFEFCIPQLASI